MIDLYRAPLTATQVKDKACELGAHLVGIADGKAMDAHPPDPDDPRRPVDISDYDADRVIVLAKRINVGTTRLTRWDERHKYYNDELTITALEEAALSLSLWLEDHGYPALIVPPTHVDPWRYQGDPSEHQEPLLSIDHAAVEAGLGTLGLNGQLLTPEYGPRVKMIAVLTSAAVEPDVRHGDALCAGPSCGRCLRACPGDVIGHWDRDWQACDEYRSPHGFKQLTDFLSDVVDTQEPAEQKAMLRSKESFYLWQSVLRGAGVVTGCRRCQDVCPVGADYAGLKDALDDIDEETPIKLARLVEMAESEAAGERPDSFKSGERWIGHYSPSAGGPPADGPPEDGGTSS
jgi:epoxyqueuosine reductase